MQLMPEQQESKKHSYEIKGMTFEIFKAATSTKYCLGLAHTPSKVDPIPFLYTLKFLRSNDFSLSFLFNHYNLI